MLRSGCPSQKWNLFIEFQKACSSLVTAQPGWPTTPPQAFFHYGFSAPSSSVPFSEKPSVCRSPSTCSRRYWGLTPGSPCPQDTAIAFRPGGVPSLVFLPPAWDTGRALAQPLGAPVRISSAPPPPHAHLCREFVSQFLGLPWWLRG